jgi:hypothetical protein
MRQACNILAPQMRKRGFGKITDDCDSFACSRQIQIVVASPTRKVRESNHDLQITKGSQKYKRQSHFLDSNVVENGLVKYRHS